MVALLDERTLQTWLEWAAVRLIAMPTGRLKPAQPRALWPDYVQDPLRDWDTKRSAQIRALAPSSAEIPIVDVIILLPNYCQMPEVRKVLHWRAQVHPLRGTHLLKWTWIADKLSVKTYTAKRWHKNGLTEVIDKTPKETVCRIAAFMETRL